MIIYSLVKMGVGKETCEDAIFDGRCIINEIDFSCKYQKGRWIAIADGVGGNAGGHDASKFVLEYIRDNYTYAVDENVLFSFLREANEKLIQYSALISGKENMATTFTGLFFGDTDAKLAYVGNTRAYVLQGKYLKQITRDHTMYQWLIEHGSAETAERCNKSEITSCFGGGDTSLLKELSIEVLTLEELPDVLLFTTDGIHDYLDIDTLEAIISEPATLEERMKKMWKTAIENGSHDDCSIIVLENDEVE